MQRTGRLFSSPPPPGEGLDQKEHAQSRGHVGEDARDGRAYGAGREGILVEGRGGAWEEEHAQKSSREGEDAREGRQGLWLAEPGEAWY